MNLNLNFRAHFDYLDASIFNSSFFYINLKTFLESRLRLGWMCFSLFIFIFRFCSEAISLSATTNLLSKSFPWFEGRLETSWFDADNQMLGTCGSNELFNSLLNAFFTCVIAQYFWFFFFEHPVVYSFTLLK